jgi:hypothetical protein
MRPVPRRDRQIFFACGAKKNYEKLKKVAISIWSTDLLHLFGA